ncbi:MAG: Na+/H+ antiporter NhaA [Paludibacter sp.]|nr:Na+/H+ antiporter NhaA [Paludibacter sp.]MDD4198635.1 Na+/H+ antiporter NhaA [Paludibacter sp.]MDD4427900.1 Na+/H+ antiporter NhaA [Paludibacter sp.]
MEFVYRNKNFAKFFGFIDKFKARTNPGVLLLFVAIVTMVIANSPLRDWYESLWKFDFFIGVENFNLLSHHGERFTLLQLVNDGIMAIFFFFVGLEIKREVLVGELSSFRQAILPIIAAVGGMIMPVVLFFVVGKAQHFSPEEMKGLAIPMATDIAFSLGVLGLLGKRVPASLRIFLLTLAIADDIGGILVIAVFYSEFTASSFLYLGFSLLLFAVLFVGNRLRVNNKLFYFINGLAIWYLFLQAGIHPTIAGVLVAFTVPARPYIDLKKFTDGLRQDLHVIESTIRNQKEESIVLTNTQVKYLTRIEAASDHVVSPLQRLEDSLHDLVNYIIMPLFAFANAGVVFDLSHISLFSGVSLSVLVGLVLGKTIGIFLFTWMAIKLRISRKPSGINWSNLVGLSMLGGIGFTVALFLAGLSYPLGSEILNNAKLGIITGSVISGILGFSLLNLTLKKSKD